MNQFKIGDIPIVIHEELPQDAIAFVTPGRGFLTFYQGEIFFQIFESPQVVVLQWSSSAPNTEEEDADEQA